MTLKDKTTGEGGNRAYFMVRSKYLKGKDGYGRVISLAREKMLKLLKEKGVDLDKVTEDMVASHLTENGDHADGSQHSRNPNDHKIMVESREDNSRAAAEHRLRKLRMGAKK